MIRRFQVPLPGNRLTTVAGISLLFLLFGIAAGFQAQPRNAPVLVDDSYEEFAAGEPDSAGQNLYVSRDGRVRSINRFDLNQDGHLDVIFNCTHDTYQMLPASVGSVLSGRQVTTTDLPVEGSQRVAAADLNRDGYSDAIICPNPIGVHHDRRFLSIAWGGPNGWSAQRVTSALPMNGAASIEVVDMNGDAWPDLAVLGSARWRPEQPEGRIIRLFWGSEAGFAANEYRDFGIPGAVEISAADFDADGAGDLAILCIGGKLTWLWGAPAISTGAAAATSITDLPVATGGAMVSGDLDADQRLDLAIGTNGKELVILRNRGDRRWSNPEQVGAFPASHITTGDLDGDGQTDVILTDFAQARAAGGEQAGAASAAGAAVRILWGERGGFDAARMLAIPERFAAATATGDLDGDGRSDLVVAVHQGKSTFGGESAIFWGTGERHLIRNPAGFRTSGTTHVAYVPAAKSVPARVIFCNSIGGHLDEAVPIHVYWGGRGGFDAQRVWKIPFHSAYEASAADLNADGHVDLIVLNSGHAGESSHEDETLGANIFWGAANGFDEKRRTVLHEHFLGTSSVADLNRDGWLDLVLEPFAAEKSGETEQLVLYYGGPDGFSRKNRHTIPSEGYSQEHLLADLNRDGWLDICVSSRRLECARIFWNGPDGFSAARDFRLKVPGALGIDAADFNADGFLDLLVGSYHDPVSGVRDMGSLIFWGSMTGYRQSNAQWLPGFSPLGRTIADLDGDGYLDLFSPQHSGELTREDLACHIYWNSREGFGTRKRTTLFCDSVNDSVAGDFDGDGRLDLAVACHTRHGDHRAESRIFYNDGQRFAQPRVQKLATNGPHLIWAADLGHQYDRKFRQTYRSRIATWEGEYDSAHLQVTSETPSGTQLSVEMRSAATLEKLGDTEWRPVRVGRCALALRDRCLQYRALFESANGDRYPVLDRVAITLERKP